MRAALTFCLLTTITARLGAQCPDGSPPPCASMRVAAVRKAPPIDDHTWIILPFDNVARRDDIDWLRDASVNLLYMDMSRWRDIKVVDDERVMDLLRAVPEARDAKRLSLNTGLAVARSAGAGRLVMGDLLKIGDKTQVVAKVFDVRRGSRIRDYTASTGFSDSVLTIFGRVAKGILNVAPPAGENVGAIGTTRVDAYQEYLAGVKALNSFDLSAARARFEQSLKLDSAFALAHYKLALALGWEGLPTRMALPHVEAAARLSGNLPPRERKLISGLRLFAVGDNAAACETFRSLVRADSSDVEATYNLADCLFHDEAVVPVKADSSEWRFRTSWNESLTLFRKVLALDPSYHIAFQHILDALKTDVRPGCARPAPDKPCPPSMMMSGALLAVVRRSGDSLATVPFRAAQIDRIKAERNAAIAANSAKQNLEQARVIAEEWMAEAPDEIRPRVELGALLILLGRLDDADRHLARVANVPLPPSERGRVFLGRYELAVKRGRGAEANAILDSLIPLGTAPAANLELRLYVTMLSAAAGRATVYDNLFAAVPLPPDLKRYMLQSLRVMMGFANADSVVAAERAAPAAMAAFPAFAQQIPTIMQSTLLLGLRLPRTEWPKFLAESTDSILAAPRALARGDTAALRSAARQLDSLMRTPSGRTDAAAPLVAAETYLVLRDSAAALARVRYELDTVLVQTAFTTTVASSLGAAAVFYPRAMLQRAELAAALGYKDEARTWYKRLLELWAKSDPEFQPALTRIRAAYQALGSP